MTSDMRAVIIPKSDQINADSLIGGPLTITISNVTIRPGTEQPVSIHYDGDDGRPWKPCKSMARVLVHCWGADANAYIGKSLTLFCDRTVKWGGMAVGGIRISHMSDIAGKQTIALTETKGKKSIFTALPLVAQQQPKQEPPKTEAPKATIAGWIAGTLAPAIAKCADLDALAKAQQSKGYLSAVARGSDDDKADIKRLCDAAFARLSPPSDNPLDDDDGFPGDLP